LPAGDKNNVKRQAKNGLSAPSPADGGDREPLIATDSMSFVGVMDCSHGRMQALRVVIRRSAKDGWQREGGAAVVRPRRPERP
jgi:hypothetical protein